MRTREIIQQAKKDGELAGENAAAWALDGNTELEVYKHVLKGIEDGDPEVLDLFRTPNLSGEFAGDPTPVSLAEEYEIEEGRRDWVLTEVCDAWTEAAENAFWRVLENICRANIERAERDEARTGQA